MIELTCIGCWSLRKATPATSRQCAGCCPVSTEASQQSPQQAFFFLVVDGGRIAAFGFGFASGLPPGGGGPLPGPPCGALVIVPAGGFCDDCWLLIEVFGGPLGAAAG